MMTRPTSDPSTRLTVLIIDGRPQNRIGLRMVLETEPGVSVVGEAGTLRDALRIAHDHQPQVVLLELVSRDAASAVCQIVARCPTCVLILLALFVDPVTQAALVAAGAAV